MSVALQHRICCIVDRRNDIDIDIDDDLYDGNDRHGADDANDDSIHDC